jgi:cytidyltransferase-like protein
MILCSGVFDGLHAGHVAYLQRAAGWLLEGERLIVAVAPDDYIRRWKSREPRWITEDRLQTVLALDMVDEAVVHNEQGVANVIEIMQPRLFIKGADWTSCLEDDVKASCIAHGVMVVFVPLHGTHGSEVWR